MYMRNKKYDNYNINSFPANYAGLHSPLEDTDANEDAPGVPDNNSQAQAQIAQNNPQPDTKTPPTAPPEKKSFLGSILGGGEKKGGILSGLFNKDGDGGFLSGIELEDLILLAVIFFLLKDGFEDDLIIILALVLLSG